MSLIDTILGRPLASNEAGEQRIGSAAGVPTFGLDALSSAAYGPEAALTVLLPLGAAGLTFIFPITVAIVILLGIVYVSYRQTIAAYPNGGGSYTVARENLGANASLLAAAALMTDYVLNVAVGISAGIGALISAVPALQPYTLPLCLVILILLTFVNLRGIGEAGRLFMLPTCVFILSLCTIGILGHARNDFLGRASASRGFPVASRQGHRSRGRVGAVARVRQRMHRDDGRRGGQQRRSGVSRAGSAGRAPHSHGHHCHPDGAAARHRVSRACLPNRRDRTGDIKLPERSISIDRRGRRPGNLLLGKHRFDSAGAVPVGEYFVCRLPETLPRGGRGRLSASLVQPTRGGGWSIRRASGSSRSYPESC